MKWGAEVKGRGRAGLYMTRRDWFGIYEAVVVSVVHDSKLAGTRMKVTASVGVDYCLALEDDDKGSNRVSYAR